MTNNHTRLADRAYIVEAARRNDTTIAAAFRRALGIVSEQPTRKSRRRRRHHSSQPTHDELEQCRRQKHGVVWRDGS